MDTCGGPDLLGTYVKGVLYLDDKQYCGNGFGVYSNTLCSYQKDCTANIIGVVACPSPTGSGGGSSSTTTIIVKYVGSPGLGIIQTASDRIVMLPSNASDFANNDPKTLTLDFANPTGPDAIGNYYIKGEVVNNGNTTIQSLNITRVIPMWRGSRREFVRESYVHSVCWFDISGLTISDRYD
jgi:hypothetical protein